MIIKPLTYGELVEITLRDEKSIKEEKALEAKKKKISNGLAIST